MRVSKSKLAAGAIAIAIAFAASPVAFATGNNNGNNGHYGNHGNHTNQDGVEVNIDAELDIDNNSSAVATGGAGGAGGAGGSATSTSTATGGAGGEGGNANAWGGAGGNSNATGGNATGGNSNATGGNAAGGNATGGSADNNSVNTADNTLTSNTTNTVTSSADNNGNNNGNDNGNNNGNNNSSSSNSQGQSQSVDNDSSNSNNSDQSVEVNTFHERAPVSTAYAAPLAAGEDTCMGSSTMGAQAVSFGLSIGTTWQDSNCRRLKNSRQLVALGYHGAATALMCVDDDVRMAMEEAGTPCPSRGNPQAQMTPVSAPVPAACPTDDFVVPFEWDRSNLNRTAVRIIDEAVTRARQCNVNAVIVVGHTDTSGSNGYNTALSQRRAVVVRNAMIERGISADLIETSSRGEADPALTTGDGVREAANRRTAVTISFR